MSHTTAPDIKAFDAMLRRRLPRAFPHPADRVEAAMILDSLLGPTTLQTLRQAQMSKQQISDEIGLAFGKLPSRLIFIAPPDDDDVRRERSRKCSQGLGILLYNTYGAAIATRLGFRISELFALSANLDLRRVAVWYWICSAEIALTAPAERTRTVSLKLLVQRMTDILPIGTDTYDRTAWVIQTAG